ncbi:MAG: GNAT family N-acetyltransferase, partial [Lachnospiraceae bacterium]|nr:GNAT family N-acetyltransferase [Lachnospiraceae bacterium]
YRGKQLGRKTVKEAEDWIRETGNKRIIIDSRLEAVKFYEKLGYERFGDEVIKSGNFDCVRMFKEV